VTITISLGVVGLLAFSLVLFLLVTWLIGAQGLFFDDTFGIGALFAIAFYAILWVIPSLIAWGIWATWFKT